MKKPAKPAKPAPFKPVTVAVQRKRHAIAVRKFRPVPVKVQVARHKAAQARKHKRKHHKKARGLALDGVACCAAEALAMSLRLAGHPVADADVLALAERTWGWDPDGGTSIEATLDAATCYGVAGQWPCGIRAYNISGFFTAETPQASAWTGREPGQVVRLAAPLACTPLGYGAVASPLLILGVDLPGAHTVLATADGWWSWGECFQPETFPDAVIEEAWAVTW